MKNPKQMIRDKILSQRQSLNRNAILQNSGLISQKILDLREVKEAATVLIYIPTGNEVETRKLIDTLMSFGKLIAVPAYDERACDYLCVEFSSWDDLTEGPFRISQPKKFAPVGPKTVDVAILPGVAFDLIGVRLGYGKGVFDRLLAESRATKIGICYDFQIPDHVPADEHDLKMDLIVTEKRIIRL